MDNMLSAFVATVPAAIPQRLGEDWERLSSHGSQSIFASTITTGLVENKQ